MFAPLATVPLAIPFWQVGELPTGHIVNLPAVEHTVEVAVPQIDVPVNQDVTLQWAVEVATAVGVPEIEVPVDNTVDLPAVEHTIEPAPPTVVAGADAIITLGNAVDTAIEVPAPQIVGEITHFVNLGNAVETAIEVAVPTTEGESDLPPTIDIPTPNQVYNFGQSGTLAAPAHSIGTGENPNWMFFVDDFGTQPGVMTWSLNAATGDITYQINQLSTDPDEQALNTKGPYNVTRRLTTTVAHADDEFTVAVNVGNRTLQVTPGGKPVMTWTTKTAASRGLEPTKDPSQRVTQTYTVT